MKFFVDCLPNLGDAHFALNRDLQLQQPLI
jgi:hypothetical protein